MSIYAVISSLLGTGVEFVEALTIILAVGSTRGWKSSLTGALTALIILGGLVAVIGAPLVTLLQTFWLQLIVGVFMLLFGARWLRKSILRYGGLKALHNEAESYQEELERQLKAGNMAPGIDKVGFATSFTGTFVEGMEAIFIVLTFGLGAKSMSSAVLGAAIATVVVILLGIILRKPLTLIPENTMKFLVGVLLTSFGLFWTGESFRIPWPQADLSILYIAASLVVLSLILIALCKSIKQKSNTGTLSSFHS
ncbi:COG4280 domain-containing protein [Alicyclobacillus fastidiosus]|uniref:COG4280 domain-containing protein n=1 Tax=Alicyclobacillus fastidiosus TaxID=392011 RepID=UPI0023E9FDF2|nr:hypothetical protein [Alicyclobacillus fastidiosus]GMA65984.1 hypothetical protein GCM10025859_64260 [Alicyclobacillus fastidiosus]